jgi:pyruvate formate lyase activating enzyme
MVESAEETRCVTGRIFDIQRFSIHDGPGIRTTVFFKGCPLRCRWCHNPEGVRPEPQLSFQADLCIGCGECLSVCPNAVHVVTDDGEHVLERDRCTVCGRCAEACPSRALEVVGREADVAEIIEEVLRDSVFYETSGGGMTLSGGEPLMQIDLAEALLRAADEAGLHCAVETCGHVEYCCFQTVLPYVALFLYDVKETDPERHREFTGVPNDLILANLRRLHDDGARILVRCPIVPGFNDRPDHFAALARLSESLPRLLGFEIMPYHRLGSSKLRRLGLTPDDLAEVEPPDDEAVAAYVRALSERGVTVVNELRR